MTESFGEAMKEIVIIAGNDTGALAKVAEVVGDAGANIEAISAYGSEGKAIFRIITSDPSTAAKALSRLPGIEVREAEIVLYKMINRPGELGKVTKKLATGGISLESVYIVSRKQDFTEIAIRPAEKDLNKAFTLLGLDHK